MKIRLLNAADVSALLPMSRCVELMRHAMALGAQGKAIQPIRQSLNHPNGRGLLSVMPGYTAEPDWLGLKTVSVFPGNFGTELGSHQGVVVLFDPLNGSPVAIMDGRQVTATRTAAATAVATDALARGDARTLSIFGYGEEAHTHLEAVPLVRRFERILVWGRDWEKAQAFCAAQSEAQGREITPIRDAEEAAVEADVICTTTAAREPFFRADWLRPGQHLNVMGSSIPTTSEIEPEVVPRTRFFVDFKDSALELAGDFRRAKAAGLVDDDHILGSIGDVLTGKVAGRQADHDVTLFKSLGMIAEDLVAADEILRESRRRGVGVDVGW